MNRDESPFMLISELNLSDGSLLNFLTADKRGLRRAFPFIIVSGSNDLEGMRLCQEEGAMDYIVKPINKNELTFKIENVLKQAKRIKKKIRPTVRLDGQEISGLTSKQVQLLSLFIDCKHHGAKGTITKSLDYIVSIHILVLSAWLIYSTFWGILLNGVSFYLFLLYFLNVFLILALNVATSNQIQELIIVHIFSWLVKTYILFTCRALWIHFYIYQI